MNEKDLEHAVRHMMSETSWFLPQTRKEKKMKEFWLRFKLWIKGFPWLLAAGAVVMGALILVFLVEGKLFVWDYVFMGLFCVALTFFVWKLAKKR